MKQINTDNITRKLHELYPEMDYKGLKKLCTYASRMLYASLVHGEDVVIANQRTGECFTIYRKYFSPQKFNEVNEPKAKARKKRKSKILLQRKIAWHYRKEIKQDHLEENS